MGRVKEWVPIGVLVLSGVVWAVRLEARVDALKQQHQAAIEQVREDLKYIRARLDQALDKGVR